MRDPRGASETFKSEEETEAQGQAGCALGRAQDISLQL